MLLIFLIFVYFVKIYSLGSAFYIDDQNSYINLAISDGVIIFLCFSIYYFSKIFNTVISRLLKSLVVVITIFYILDLFVVYAFNTRLYIDDIGKFTTNIELDVVNPIYIFLSVCLLCLSFMFLVKKERKDKRVGVKAIISLLLMVFSGSYNVDTSIRSSFFKNYIFVNLSATYKNEYTEGFIDSFSYANNKRCKTVKKIVPKNIVVFLFESWSYYHSQWFGGENDWTPELDKLAKENISYQNFYANGFTTEAGLYALFTGDVLIPYKVGYGTDGALGLNSIGYTFALPENFAQLGYNTKFITSGNLSFLNKGDWLRTLGFETIIGNEAFEEKERKFLFDSVSDEVLYRKLDTLLREDEYNFIVVENVNTHQPYYYPDNGEIKRSEEFAFRYADKQLANTIRELSSSDTMIVVVSDHRAMTPMTEKEVSDSGRMAASKVPMFIVWQNESKTINSAFQQTDVLTSISGMLKGEQCTNYSRGALFPIDNSIESKCTYYARGDERSKVSVMCEKSKFDVLLDGDDTRVLGKEGFEHNAVDYLNMIRIKNDQGNR